MTEDFKLGDTFESSIGGNSASTSLRLNSIHSMRPRYPLLGVEMYGPNNTLFSVMPAPPPSGGKGHSMIP